MAHKKSLLQKYSNSSTEFDDCRSPRHDGKRWFIPETSVSGVENDQREPTEPPEPNVQNQGTGNNFLQQFENFLATRSEARSSSGKSTFS